MIDIVVPPHGLLGRIQEADGRWYWSRCAETLFRREGYVAVRTVCEPDPQHLAVRCRATGRGDGGPCIVEGPLDSADARALGLRAEPRAVEHVELGAPVDAALRLPEVHLRSDDGERAPAVHEGADAAWGGRRFEIQFLSGPGWDVVLEGTDPTTGEQGAVAVRRGDVLVFGLAILDLLLRWTAIPPLDGRYAGFTAQLPHADIGQRVVALVADHARRCEQTLGPRLSRWPAGLRAGFTIRHDYDRPVDADALRELLDVYARAGVHANIGILPQLLDGETIDLFREAGHEIQAHVASASRVELRDDLRALRREALAPVRGATIHGGPKGLGFRGQTHYEWFDDLGLDYAEIFGLRGGVPLPISRLYHGTPDVSRLMAMPGHHSMDGSTRPDDHRLARLAATVPGLLQRGEHVIVMNHPDVHREQLAELIGVLDLSRVWCATSGAIATWFRTVAYESQVRRTPAGYEVAFPAPLSRDVTATVGDRADVISSGTRKVDLDAP